jgi:hypothetical protein
VSDANRQRVVAPALAIGSDHAVHVLYYDLGEDARDYQGLEGPTWDGRWSLVLTSSTDEGRSFAPGVAVDREIVPPERVMLIYTMAPAALATDGSRLYASWYDARNQDWDVFLRWSADGGQTWAALQRLNDDPLGDGRDQYLPRLAVAPGGRVDAIFYDRRNDPRNVLSDVSYTSSSDGGRTFSPNLQINDESFSSQIGTRYPIPSAKGLVEFGSRIALLARKSNALAAWTDTRNQDVDGYGQDVFATEIDLSARVGRSRSGSVPVASAAVAAGIAAITGALAWRRRRTRPDAPHIAVEDDLAVT